MHVLVAFVFCGLQPMWSSGGPGARADIAQRSHEPGPNLFADVVLAQLDSSGVSNAIRLSIAGGQDPEASIRTVCDLHYPQVSSRWVSCVVVGYRVLDRERAFADAAPAVPIETGGKDSNAQVEFARRSRRVPGSARRKRRAGTARGGCGLDFPFSTAREHLLLLIRVHVLWTQISALSALQ